MEHHSSDYTADILIIDPHLDEIYYLTNLLLAQGYKVRKSITGQFALTSIELTLPDLILMEIHLQDLDAYEFVKTLRSNEKTCQIPIIFMGCQEDNPNWRNNSFVHKLDFVSKPLNATELVIRVENQIKLTQAENLLSRKEIALQEEISYRQKLEVTLERVNQELNFLQTELKKTHQKLKQTITLDGLTQVANRRHFEHYLRLEWQRLARDKMPLSIILCDLDEFRAYNEAYGCQKGDECLIQISQIIRQTVKRPADLVARYSGKEFAIILPNTKSMGAIEVAKFIRLEIKKLKILHPQSSVSDYVTVSLGVATTIPVPDLPADTILTIAEEALDEAKRQGCDRIGVGVHRLS